MSIAVLPKLPSCEKSIPEEEPVCYKAGDAGVTCLFQGKECHHTSKIHVVIFSYGT